MTVLHYGEEIKNFDGGIFLLGGEKLRSDFDNSSLFQS